MLGAAVHGIVDARAIDGDAGAVGIAAENGDVHGAVVVALVVGGDGDTGREEGELQEAAAVERELLDLLAADDLVDGVSFDFELRVDGFDGDGVLLLAHLQVRVDRGDAAGSDDGFDGVSMEAGRFDAHFVGRRRPGTARCTGRSDC